MVEPVHLSEIEAALGVGDHELVALVGGGGKTTTLLALGRQLAGRVVLTTTTKMGAEQTAGRLTLVAPTDKQLEEALASNGVVFVRRDQRGGKSLGVDPSDCDRWFDIVDHVVVEADGTRRRPFSAPRPHEPVVPTRATTVVACIGADALGRVIADQCHNPLRVAAVAGCSPYQRLTPERAARVLLADRGARKGCPPAARFVLLVTKVTAAALPLVADLAAAIEGTDPTWVERLVAVAFDPEVASDYPPRR